MPEIELLPPKRCVRYQRDGGYRIGHVYGKVTEECEKALVRESLTGAILLVPMSMIADYPQGEQSRQPEENHRV